MVRHTAPSRRQLMATEMTTMLQITKQPPPLAVRLTKARTALLLDHPFFGALLFRLVFQQTSGVATMATDGVSLFYNPQFVESLPPGELVGVLAHEVMHPALHHDTRRGGRDRRLWNVACDYAINPLLVEAGLQLPPDRLLDVRFVGMSAEQVYNLLDRQREEPQPDCPPGKEGQKAESAKDPETSTEQPTAPETPGGFGQVLDARRPETLRAPEHAVEQTERHEREWRIAVEQAENIARFAGSISAGLERTIEAGDKASVDWREVLRRTFSETLPADYTWVRPNRRHLSKGLYLPGTAREGAGEIVIAVDCSGSISKRVLGLFQAEIGALVREHQPERVHVLYFDVEVHRRELFARGETIALNPAGGGGTDFGPVFADLKEQGIVPHSVIVLTDLEGSFPAQEPPYPVIWASTKPGRPPFGATVSIEAA
jgi:predicted metal-dependent peptidase